MEKDAEAPPLEKQRSYDGSVWSHVEQPESPGLEEQPDPADIENNVEQIPPRLELTRTNTGPPYSIFSQKTKLFIIISVSISSLISPFGATTFYPALNVLAKDLHVTATQVNLALTTYMVCTA